ncbi:hypothetical protein [Negativicoccus succinicivorans]|uniref:hypothetical protein n=1 Tax=Negativicoccus succinicivorans TaxID=620903 RepID=UPI00235763D2|nr:hypothetical protein [Negativicoccus succinicivorans]MDU5647879.1 hypothetical protein [Haemophilus parainfluenzae]MBS5890740.1 hypothetical protein [Negativicoccus succinicivorans]MDU0987139.1 hypothetical protein [Negativicoccus succinicivorans]MDU1066553.1 hypothetical protein [Negativicoccus succinicivorans]MDU2930176.1 hypothetical protein [Negativicoccus succinicivorans]
MFRAYIREDIVLPERKSKAIQELVDTLERLHIELQSMDPRASEYARKIEEFEDANEWLDIAAKLDDKVDLRAYAKYCFRYYVGVVEDDDQDE